MPYKLVYEIENKTDWKLVDTIVWKKSCGLPFPANERRLSRNWEFVWIFARKNEIDTFEINKGVKSISEKTGELRTTLKGGGFLFSLQRTDLQI